MLDIYFEALGQLLKRKEHETFELGQRIQQTLELLNRSEQANMEGEQRLRNLKQAIGAACDQFQTDIGKGAADRAVLMKKWGVLYTAVKAAFGGSLSKNAPL